MIISNNELGCNEIVCFTIKKTGMIIYVTEFDFCISQNCELVNHDKPSWWVESKVGDCVINGPGELLSFQNIFELVVESEYCEMKDVDKLRDIRENEVSRQLKEIIVSNFNSVDIYLDIVKRDKYKDYLKDYVDKGYEYIMFDDFRVDKYLAMQLDIIEKYINAKSLTSPTN